LGSIQSDAEGNTGKPSIRFAGDLFRPKPKLNIKKWKKTTG
jgi:hypothetical protein